jgi:hypothetical protein
MSGQAGDELVIRRFRPGDEAAVNAAFNRVFRCSRTLAEWSWKCPPAPGGRPIMLAVRGGEVLAQYAGVPVRFQVDGRVVMAAQIVDKLSTAAASDGLSRRGLMVRTVQSFFSELAESGEYPLLYGLPGRRSLRFGLLQLGYEAMPPQDVVYLKREVAAAGAGWRRLPYRAEPARDWEPRLDSLWERVRASYPVAAVRDAERALARLAGHPTVRYHRWLVFPRLSDEPVAFAAFRSDDHMVRWVDLLWDHEHPAALDLLSHLALRLAGQAYASVEELWLNGDTEGRRRLEALGFEQRPEPSGLVLVARSFDPTLDVTRLDQRVYLTMADADLV